VKSHFSDGPTRKASIYQVEMRVRVRLELLLPQGLRRNHPQRFPTYRSLCLASAFSEQTVAKVRACLLVVK
jgi:hypothetical protein